MGMTLLRTVCPHCGERLEARADVRLWVYPGAAPVKRGTPVTVEAVEGFCRRYGTRGATVRETQRALLAPSAAEIHTAFETLEATNKGRIIWRTSVGSQSKRGKNRARCVGRLCRS